jgi:hypothetical protein
MSCITCIAVRIKNHRKLLALAPEGSTIALELIRLIEEDEKRLKEKTNG